MSHIHVFHRCCLMSSTVKFFQQFVFYKTLQHLQFLVTASNLPQPLKSVVQECQPFFKGNQNIYYRVCCASVTSSGGCVDFIGQATQLLSRVEYIHASTELGCASYGGIIWERHDFHRPLHSGLILEACKQMSCHYWEIYPALYLLLTLSFQSNDDGKPLFGVLGLWCWLNMQFEGGWPNDKRCAFKSNEVQLGDNGIPMILLGFLSSVSKLLTILELLGCIL